MATEAQIAANRRNAQSAAGPRTPAGKSRSSRNAVHFGIYSSADFVQPGEHGLYRLFCRNFHHELCPAGPLEQTLAAEIIHAAWRLRRCSAVESGLLDNPPTDSITLDPMVDAAASPTQQTIDRARAQAHRNLHRASAELRRLQTERQVRVECLPQGFDITAIGGLASFKDLIPTLALDLDRKLRLHKLDGTDTLNAIINATSPPVARATEPPSAVSPESPLTKQTQSAEPAIGRNAPCPCNSGIKYKRCCGPNAPAILRFAA